MYSTHIIYFMCLFSISGKICYVGWRHCSDQLHLHVYLMISTSSCRRHIRLSIKCRNLSWYRNLRKNKGVGGRSSPPCHDGTREIIYPQVFSWNLYDAKKSTNKQEKALKRQKILIIIRDNIDKESGQYLSISIFRWV